MNRSLAMEPVFLALGQTVYVCQCFEGSIVALLALFNEEVHGTNDGRAFQATIDNVSRKTLGPLLDSARKIVDVAPQVDELLKEGLELRNRVIHRFADEFAGKVQSPHGRAEVVAELFRWRLRLIECDDAVHAMLNAILARRGVSVQDFVRRADDLWNTLNPSDGQDAPSKH
ncbi:MAG: hypothetical protein J0L57_04445 [Burkholderiales bacterium]|nr:hypothetical protein [Burkholderiales bacterium]